MYGLAVLAKRLIGMGQVRERHTVGLRLFCPGINVDGLLPTGGRALDVPTPERLQTFSHVLGW